MRKRHPISHRPGMVLIAVLLILSVIMALVLEFHYDSRIGFQLAENTRAACQALNCAQAGLAIATAALERTRNIWSDDGLVQALSGSSRIPVGEGYCTISVTGQSGRINVNELVDGNGRPVRTKIDQLLLLIDLLNAQNDPDDRISYDLVPAIIDWIDPDNEVTVLPFVQGRNAGAESDYYGGLEKPYECKNGPLEVLSELMLVKGVTKGILYGGSPAQRDGSRAGLEEFLTVHGRGRLNINDASAIMLQTFSTQIDRAMAEKIVQGRPYTNANDLAKVPGMTPEVLKVLREHTTLQADDEYYTVTSCGTVGKSTRTLRVVLCRDRRQGRITPVIRWEP